MRSPNCPEMTARESLLPSAIEQQVTAIYRHKLEAAQGHVIPVPADLLRWLRQTQIELKTAADAAPAAKHPGWGPLNALVRQWVAR